MRGMMGEGVVGPVARPELQIAGVAERGDFADGAGVQSGLNSRVGLQEARGVGAAKQHAVLLRFMFQFLGLR